MSQDSVNNNKKVEKVEHSLQGDFQLLTQDMLNGTNMEGNDTIDDEPSNTWSCHKCTLDNLNSETVCLACGGSKFKSVHRTFSANSIKRVGCWVCNVCTLENAKGVKKCKACDTARDGNLEEINFAPSRPGFWVCKVYKLHPVQGYIYTHILGLHLRKWPEKDGLPDVLRHEP